MLRNVSAPNDFLYNLFADKVWYKANVTQAVPSILPHAFRKVPHGAAEWLQGSKSLALGLWAESE